MPHFETNITTDGDIILNGNQKEGDVVAAGGVFTAGAAQGTTYSLHAGGKTKIDTISNATSDTDKFLVSDSGEIKYRTGTQLVSDLGAVSGFAYLPLAGNSTSTPITSNVYLSNIVPFQWRNFANTANTFSMLNDANNDFFLINESGGRNFELWNQAEDGDITFYADSGNGTATEYFRLDGSAASTGSALYTKWPDKSRITLGSSTDLELYHDGSNSYILNATADLYIDSNGDDLYLRASDDVVIQSQGSENAIYCTGNSGVQLYHNGSEKLETKSDGIDVTGNINFGTSDGDLEMSEGSHIVLNAMQSPLAGAEANGLVIKLHTSTTVFGKIYYKSHQAAAWSYANAGNDGTTRMLGLALGTSSSNDGMLLQGIIRIASHGLSAGAPLYVSTTNGEFTTTAPSSGGDYVRVVGYTIDSNTIYFNPSGTWVEVSN